MNYEDHARHACEGQFNDYILRMEEHSRTNTLFKVEFSRLSPKTIKYHTFRWHPTDKFLGGAYAQNYLSMGTDLVPDVQAIHEKDPFESVQTSWYISDFIEGETFEVFNSEDFQKNIALEIASELGRTLAEIHNVTFDVDVDLPLGEVMWRPSQDRFKAMEPTWSENVSAIAQARHQSYKPNDSRVSESAVDQLYDYVNDTIDSVPDVTDDPVISNLDFRPGNIAFDNLRSQSKHAESKGIFDWDRAMYGDWQFGLALGEFFLTNTCQSRNMISDLQEAYRSTYFDHTNKPLSIDKEAYRTYLALQYLQQCRSFNYWYKDRNESWLEAQRQLTENHIEKVTSNGLI